MTMQRTDLSAEMRSALRHLAKAVAIITTRWEGRRYAMVATAVSELSLDPPSMLICVNKSASISTPLIAGSAFCVCILHSTHQEIASICSGRLKGEARFTDGEWCEDAKGTPFLPDAQAVFLCHQDGRFSYGTHDVFVGRVHGVSSQGITDPLVYVDGRYTTVSPRSV